MQVPDFIRQIPIQFDNACMLFIAKGAETQQWIADYGKTKINEIGQSTFWQQYAQPIYYRNFSPLTKTDYLLFAGSVATALIGTRLAVNRFSIGALPLAAGAGTLMVMASYYFSRHRVHTHFNEVAWNYIDEIRGFAHITTTKNQKFGDISQRRAYLMRSEFERLDGDLKLLDEEIRKFRIAVLTPHSEDKKEIVKAHLDLLRIAVPSDSADENLLDELEEAIDKAGQKDQDLKEIETQKQKLATLQTPAVRPHINELKKQIDELVKAAEGPNFKDAKKSFIEHLEGLQHKLAPYKNIEPLLDIEDEDESDTESEVDSEDHNSPLPDILVEEENQRGSQIRIEEVED